MSATTDHRRIRAYCRAWCHLRAALAAGHARAASRARAKLTCGAHACDAAILRQTARRRGSDLYPRALGSGVWPQ